MAYFSILSTLFATESTWQSSRIRSTRYYSRGFARKKR